MLILALDTTGKIASCALLRDGELLGEASRDAMADHSSILLPLCEGLLAEHGYTVGQVDLFAAAVGPGSFTGVRIGISAVKGFSFATGKRCVGVSTLHAGAYAYPDMGTFCQCLPARGEESYIATFARDAHGVHRIDDERVATEQDIAQLALPRHVGGNDAHHVALAAWQLAQAGQTCDAGDLQPSYLRIPQAERLQQQKEKQA